MASNGVPRVSRQHLEVADVLVNVWKVEGKSIEARLGDFLLC